MPVSPSAVSKGSGVHEVYERLRQEILDGSIAPGEIVNQVHVAKRVGVSRTPVREALRMLQAENLVEAQFQYRMRVTEITPQEVDATYATWILVQALGTALTVAAVTPGDMVLIREALREMNAHNPARSGSKGGWGSSHTLFHQRLLAHAGQVIIDSVADCWTRLERARHVYMNTAPQSWLDSEEEHNELADAYEAGDVERAVHIATRQLTRIARIVISNIDPLYEPVAIREALNLISPSAAPTPPRAAAARGRRSRA